MDEYLGNAGTPEEAGQLQPSIAEANATATAQPDAPEPITKQYLDNWKSALTKELTEEMRRVVQSQTGKAESRIKKDVESKLMQVDANFKSLREAGFPVTDEDLKQARSQAMRETMSSLQEDDSAAQRNQPAPDPQRQAVANETTKALRALQKQYGYVLGENEPEYWDLVDADVAHAETPEKFLEMHEAALREFVTRTGRPLPQQQAPAQISNPAARIAPPVGAPISGNRQEQLTRRLNEIQSKGLLLSKADQSEKKTILEELKTYDH